MQTSSINQSINQSNKQTIQFNQPNPNNLNPKPTQSKTNRPQTAAPVPAHAKISTSTCWMFCTTKSVSLVTFLPRVDIVTRTKYLSRTLRPLYDSYGFSAWLKSNRYCCVGKNRQKTEIGGVTRSVRNRPG